MSEEYNALVGISVTLDAILARTPTLRQQYAMRAMHGWLSSNNFDGTYSEVAADSFRLADAMILEDGKTK